MTERILLTGIRATGHHGAHGRNLPCRPPAGVGLAL